MAIARVQGAAQVDIAGSSASALTISLNGTTAGNYLVLYASIFDLNSTWTIGSVTDGGDSFTVRSATTTDFGGSNARVRSVVAYARIGTGGNKTVSVNLSGASAGSNRYAVLGLEEWTGIADASPEDTWAANDTQLLASADINAGPITTTEAGDVLLGVATYMDGDDNLNFASPSGWTNRYRQNDSNSILGADAASWLPGSIQTSYTAQWSHDNASMHRGCGVIVALKSAGGDTPAPTIHTESLASALAISDAIPRSILRSRQLTSSIAPADEVIKSVISSLVLSTILSSALSVNDSIQSSARRSRMASSSISVTEGDFGKSSIANMDAADSLSISDDQAWFLLRRRLLGDDIGVSDELLAQTTGVIIYQRILDSLTTITDESVAFAYLRRLAGSDISVADQIDRYTLMTRVLLDALSLDDDFDASLVLDQIIARILTSDIGLFDEPMSAMQRFILLSEVLSVQDDMTAAHIPHVGGLFVPRIMIGFDQPKIELGGYRV